MKNLHVPVFVVLLSVSASLGAQSVTGPPGPAPTTPLDGGAIIMPPESEIGLPEQPAQREDNKNSKGSPTEESHGRQGSGTSSVAEQPSGDIPAGAGQKPARKNFEKNESKKAGCEGPKDLCRQSSAQ
jgi:hypothetical protein